MGAPLPLVPNTLPVPLHLVSFLEELLEPGEVGRIRERMGEEGAESETRKKKKSEQEREKGDTPTNTDTGTGPSLFFHLFLSSQLSFMTLTFSLETIPRIDAYANCCQVIPK